MKKLVRMIRNWIIVICIALALTFRIHKNGILLTLNRINLRDYNYNLINAIYLYCHSALIHGLIDSNEAFRLYVELTNKI